MQNQDTESLFKKKLNFAIPSMVFIIVLMVLRGIASLVYGYYPSVPSILGAHLAALIYAIMLLVFAAIGKTKGTENRIMSFVFGIITIGLGALLILDRVSRVFINIDNIVDYSYIMLSNPLYIVDWLNLQTNDLLRHGSNLTLL
nr:hypothetical protein [Candidatus Sigynarchaeum springense]